MTTISLFSLPVPTLLPCFWPQFLFVMTYIDKTDAILPLMEQRSMHNVQKQKSDLCHGKQKKVTYEAHTNYVINYFSHESHSSGHCFPYLYVISSFNVTRMQCSFTDN